MSNLNKVIIEGNLCADPEIRQVGETHVVKFRVATNRRFKSKGEWVDKTTFLTAEAWDKGAEAINKFFKKGDPIIVEGEITSDEWEDKNTHEKRTAIVIRVGQFHMLRGYNYEEHNWSGPRQKGATKKSATKEAEPVAAGAGHADEDIPF